MSTSYFIMTKSCDKAVDNNDNNQVVLLNNNQSFILPKNLMECYVTNGLFESNLIEWSKQFCSKNKIFLDIGAHTGTYSISLSLHSKEVYSFEPQKMTYYALCGSVALSNRENITCLNVGLGSEEQVGKKTLNIISNDGGGSTIHETNNVLRKEEINIQTLDSYELSNIGFIKMDVEDNEYFVLVGGTKTLRESNFPPILFESNRQNDQLFDYLMSLGYHIKQINGFNMFLAKIN